jgi:hypothetical protein
MQEAACTDDDGALHEHSEALSLADFFAWRLLTIKGQADAAEGTITGSSASAAARCEGATCYARLGANLALTATPASGFAFSHWSGCSVSTSPTLTLRHVHRNLTCKAEFVPSVRFEGLGDLPGGDTASAVVALSDDGEVLVGNSSGVAGNEGFRWSHEAGLVGLGGPSAVEDVSPDGRYVVGGNKIWAPGVAVEILGPADPAMAPAPGWYVQTARDVRNDGTVYATCVQYMAYGEPIPCRVKAHGAVEQISTATYVILAADDQGNLAGYQVPPRHENNLFGTLATFNGPLGYPNDSPCVTPHQCRSEAQAFSADHATIVGTSRVPAAGPPGAPEEPLFDTAWVYTPDEGMRRLPELAGGGHASGALDVSDDGRVIAGFGASTNGRRAVLWIDRVPRTLEELIQSKGGTIPNGWTLLEATAVSRDARVIVGNATNAQGNPEAFRVVFPSELGA